MDRPDLTGLILEPLRLPRAIPNVKRHWCLPEMDVNNADLQEDTRSLHLMIAGEERGFVDLYRKYQGRFTGLRSKFA